MIVSDAIWQIVGRYCDTVFFLPGGQAAFLVDSLGRSGLKHISMLHEAGAGFAACGYAQARNGLGVCLTTSGPGATNAITPCAAAWMDSVPVLFISGQSNLNPNEKLRVRGVQAVDIVSLVKPITKRCYCVPADVEGMVTYLCMRMIKRSIEICLEGRPGPCWVDIPLDVQAREWKNE